MAIDPAKVKAFWDSRAGSYSRVAFESVANLEEDPDNLRLKIELETAKVSQYLGSVGDKTIVDLGAGVGQWAFRFADQKARSIVAVEYSAELARIGREEAKRRGVGNVTFVISPAEEFRSEKTFDIVFISGLFVNMNDDQAEKLMTNLPAFCRKDTVVLLRDGTSILRGRYEINNRKSDLLQSMYSAVYRTRSEYLELFGGSGFSLVKDENMFDETCRLNKYPETRLRIYRFLPSGGA